MGKKKICGSCKQEYEDSKKEKLKRSIVNSALKSIKVAIPGIEEVLEGSKDFCFKCYATAILKGVGPTYRGMLGIIEEAEDEKPETGSVSEDY